MMTKMMTVREYSLYELSLHDDLRDDDDGDDGDDDHDENDGDDGVNGADGGGRDDDDVNGA